MAHNLRYLVEAKDAKTKDMVEAKAKSEVLKARPTMQQV